MITENEDRDNLISALQIAGYKVNRHGDTVIVTTSPDQLEDVRQRLPSADWTAEIDEGDGERVDIVCRTYIPNTEPPGTYTRESLDYVVRVKAYNTDDGHSDQDYRDLGSEWGGMPDDGDDLRVLMVRKGTDEETLKAIERLLDTDPTIADWCPLVDPGEPLDDAAWESAISIVRA